MGDHGAVARAAALLTMLAACEPTTARIDDAGASDGAVDPDPIVTEADLRTLRTLRYDDAPPPADPSNRFADDPAARRFGQRMFFETSLSGPLLEGDNDGSTATLGVVGEPDRVSCAGCHLPRAGFVDTRSNHRQISLAAQWTMRRSPTLLEIGLAPIYNWDGRRDSLWGQAIGVMESDREFNSGRLFVAEQIFRLHRAEYESIFGSLPALDDAARFPPLSGDEAGCDIRGTIDGQVLDCRGRPGDGADYDGMTTEDQRLVTDVTVNVAKAIAAYLRQLRCGESRFDAWLDGDATALTRSEIRGAALFAGRARCTECHTGPRLTDDQFHNVGLSPAAVALVLTDTDDRGAAAGMPLLVDDPLSTRGEFSDGARDVLPSAFGPELEGAFRTPTLRCVPGQPSFMHTAQLQTLESVVAFFARGGDRYGYPGVSELHELDLDDRERADLTAFLGSLEGPGPDETLLEALP